MKQSGKCPKCASKDIIADAKAVDRGDQNWEGDLSVATFGKPDAIIFKDKRKSFLSAWVCRSCGFVELYTDQPRGL